MLLSQGHIWNSSDEIDMASQNIHFIRGKLVILRRPLAGKTPIGTTPPPQELANQIASAK